MTASALPRATPESVGLAPDRLARLTAVMARQVQEKKAPGVSMLFARNGKVAYRESVGLLRPDGPSMPEDAIFRIYSMTKPIVSVAAMTFVEEGRLFLTDPLSLYLPAFTEMKVGIERGDALDLVPAKRPIAIQDLMRHTSGLTYGFTGTGQVQKMMLAAGVMREQGRFADQIARLAALPLQHQPGEVWEYSHSTDVLGHVLEIIAGRSLGEILRERVLAPLQMHDTGFYTPAEKLARRAEPFSFDSVRALNISTIDATAPPMCEFGGGGLVSTMGDYARFSAMLLNEGALDGTRVIGSRTLRFMTSDHLGPNVVKTHALLPAGHGFGLGFAVRLEPGLAATPGAVGEYLWGGLAGTTFWISPRDGLVAIMMIQAPDYRDHFRLLFRSLVYAALD